MPKLFSGKQIIKALTRLGFTVISQKGSHIKLRRIENDNVFTVIVPNHKEIAIGTMQSILRQAGVTREELEEKM